MGFENQALALLITAQEKYLKTKGDKIMKVLYRVIYLFALVVLLTACGGKAITTEPVVALTEIPMDTSQNATEVPTAIEMPTQTESTDPFELSVAQHVMDAAGFHEIATALSETQTIDPEYFSTVTGVSKVLAVLAE